MIVDAAWVLSLMLKSETNAASSPWRKTYEPTADAIARVATEMPLYAGEDGANKTAALLVSVAWFESHFQPDALGDFAKRADGTKGEPQSFCAFQIGRTNFGFLGVTRESITSSIEICTRAAVRMMRVSFTTCRAEVPALRLAHYAGGGGTCPSNADARRKSQHRVSKAMYLLATVPPPSPATVAILPND